jgi:AraC family transcriptional regulator
MLRHDRHPNEAQVNDSSAWTDYGERLGRVIGYIHDHLDERLDLNKLAEIACLSPHHWHRVYHAIHGETIAATVKRLRLHRAAGYLANTAMPIEEIAERSGYRNLQSFTRIFGSVYGMPPAQYRRNGSHARFQQQERGSVMHEVVIKKLPAMQAVGVDHTGSYMEIDRAFEALFRWLGARNLIAPDMRMVGLYYDDPSSIPEDELRSRACVLVGKSLPIEAPVRATEIAGGSYAVLRHKGPYADMPKTYLWLYGTWLLQSGKEIGDGPILEEYLNNPRDTPPTELLTEICLPLA